MLTRLQAHPAGRCAVRFWHLLVYRRVSGLSAEAAFWLVFSLPWLLLGVVSVIGIVDKFLPAQSIAELQDRLLAQAERWLTPEVVQAYAEPLVTDLFSKGAAGVGVVSFIVALWAGSRCIQTFIEAHMIINGQFRQRGWLRIRLMSVGLLIAGGLLLAILLPLLSFGPRLFTGLTGVDGPLMPIVGGAVTVLLLVVIIVAVQFYSLTDRPSLKSLLPGALLMVVGWGAGAVYLSYYVRRLFADTSVYGVLAAPIAVILYALVACLVAFWGVTLNAALSGVDAGPEAAADEDGAPASGQPPDPQA
ncbi:MAG: YihY/virulence factor BrkB family protein [Candidatus Nanopelagicales bacterium]